MDHYNSPLAKLVGKFFAPHESLGWAITLFGVAYYSVPEEQVTDSWRDHENCHKHQQRRDGWKFYPRYLWYSIKHSYRNNPYEVEARLAEFEGLWEGEHE